MTKYIDLLDKEMIYSEYDTIALGVQHVRARELCIRSLSRHNKVFDALREPDLLLPLFLAIPCFIRILEEPIYNLLENQIIREYSNPEDASLPPLIVFGNRQLHEHPLIFMANEEAAKSCWSIYKKHRRQAKRAAKKELK